MIFRAPGGGWLIVDEVLGRGRLSADLHWHFDPSWTVTRETPTRLRAAHPDGDVPGAIDQVEARIRERVPPAKVIYIEPDEKRGTEPAKLY